MNPISVSLHIENAVGYVTFSHLPHHALPIHLLAELEQRIIDAGTNKAIKVIVLRSEGERTFCAGADFNELINLSNEADSLLFFSGFAKVINAMRNCPKLIVGSVQGKAVGGGVGLIAATDYCFATQFAEIKLSELSIAIGPFVIEPAVTRRIGINATTKLSLNPTLFFSAKWAKRKGLYAEIFDNKADLDNAIKMFAENLATYNTEALNAIKQAFWEGTSHWDELLFERAKISGKLALSSYTKAQLERFKT